MLALCVAGEGERPGADGDRAAAAQLVGIGRQCLRRVEAEVGSAGRLEERGKRPGKIDLDGVWIDDVGPGVGAEQACGVLRFCRLCDDMIKIDPHGIGGEVGAVGERDPLPQPEGKALQVRCDVPGSGQPRVEFTGIVLRDKGVEDVTLDRRGDVLLADVDVEAGRFGVDPVGQGSTGHRFV